MKEQEIISPTVIYIKMERSVAVQKSDVLLKDVASVECRNRQIKEQAEKVCIYRFEGERQKRAVVSVLRVIQLLEKEQFDSEKRTGICLIQSVGEKDVFIQRTDLKTGRPFMKPFSIALVSMITFFGTAFTIVAYHNDIEIRKIFEGTVKMVLPQNLEFGLLSIEVAYSIGLALGIVVFFNHVGKWKLSNDPTPMEVALRKYEMEVDTTIIENAERQGEEVEAK